MRWSPVNWVAGALTASAACLACCGNAARGAPGTPGTAPADKDCYNLFNPTPRDQMRDMDIDRPNATNSPHTIDAGHFQVEAGVFDYGYDRQRYDGVNTRSDTLTAGQFNLRLGVLNDLELNAVLNAFAFQRNTDYLAPGPDRSDRQSGFGDTFVGGKLNLWGNDGADDAWTTALAIQPQLRIPTARRSLGPGRPELFVGLPFAMNLPADFHLGLQTTGSWERNAADTGYVAGWQNSINLDHVFFDKLDVYLEYSSHVTTERHQLARQFLNTGLTYDLTDNVILDTGFGFGLNKASPTFEWLAGISVRF